MTYDVWFVPGNSSHAAKFKDLMDALRDRGHRLFFLCIDSVHRATQPTKATILETKYPFTDLHADGYDPNGHWFRQGLQRGSIVRSMRRLMDEHPIDAIIVGSDNGVPIRAIVQVALERRVPIVHIPDGLVLPRSPRYRRSCIRTMKDAVKKRLMRRMGVGIDEAPGYDLTFVINEHGRGVYERAGVPSDLIQVMGSPEYDSLARSLREVAAKETDEDLRKKMGLLPGQPIVFFAHQPLIYDTDTARQLVRDMVAGARKCGAVVLVKFHPRGKEWPDAWRQWAAGEKIGPGEAVFLRDECTSIEAARVCAVCVTVFSTVALEALVCGKPIIIIQYLNVPLRLEFAARYGVAIDVHSGAELQDAVATVVSDPAVRERLHRGRALAVEHELPGLDGRCTERMLEAIIGLIEKKKGINR